MMPRLLLSPKTTTAESGASPPWQALQRWWQMIKVTTMDGTEMYLNCDLIESITESPETRITLSNGNHYIAVEPARVLLRRIVDFRAEVLRKAGQRIS
jgi:flagellar protein FlbD